MPRLWAWPLAAAACAYGFWLARQEWCKPIRRLPWPATAEALLVEDERMDQVQLQWRGPLAFLRWRDGKGRIQWLSWWPDTLPPAQRRELKLAERSRPATPAPASMSP